MGAHNVNDVEKNVLIIIDNTKNITYIYWH